MEARVARGGRRVKMTVYLSQEASQNLERLKFKKLDKDGKKPTGSRIIEGLLKTALKNERIPPYLGQAAKFAQSLARGEPNRSKIAWTVLSDKVRELI
ncbi:MAG TPA: hypothetical protein VGL70_06410 [Candidatus Binatia bacterium]|jgi:hypothetical protein